jgi:hypothetical protein
MKRHKVGTSTKVVQSDTEPEWIAIRRLVPPGGSTTRGVPRILRGIRLPLSVIDMGIRKGEIKMRRTQGFLQRRIIHDRVVHTMHPAVREIDLRDLVTFVAKSAPKHLPLARRLLDEREENHRLAGWLAKTTPEQLSAAIERTRERKAACK